MAKVRERPWCNTKGGSTEAGASDKSRPYDSSSDAIRERPDTEEHKMECRESRNAEVGQ